MDLEINFNHITVQLLFVVSELSVNMSKLRILPKMNFVAKRTFSFTCVAEARKPPREEYENNMRHTRKKTADPFDR